MRLISKQPGVDMQVKSKNKILFKAIICLFCSQLGPEPSVATDNMPSQRKIEAQTVQTLKKQPVETKLDQVLAIPGLSLKLRSGGGCAVHANDIISRHIVATYPFKIEEVCFGDTKGPDIKHDFRWFRIIGIPSNSLPVEGLLPPGLVLSLYPGGSLPRDDLIWNETTAVGFFKWKLIEKLPKFTMVGLKYHGTPNHPRIIIMGREKNKSFKWQEKVYDCAELEGADPPGFRRVFLYDYCWFEKTTGPDILP
jgi:hypothetical protein